MATDFKSTGVTVEAAAVTAHAWVRWDQSDVVRDNAHNVSGITDTGVGRCTITMATALTDVEYVVTLSPKDNNWGGSGTDGWYDTYATTSFKIANYGGDSGYHDSGNMSVVVFGDPA